MLDGVRVVVAVVLWTSSGAMMIGGAIWSTLPLMVWGCYVAMVACMVTGWIIADCVIRKDRLRVREIARLVAERKESGAQLPRVGR